VRVPYRLGLSDVTIFTDQVVAMQRREFVSAVGALMISVRLARRGNEDVGAVGRDTDVVDDGSFSAPSSELFQPAEPLVASGLGPPGGSMIDLRTPFYWQRDGSPGYRLWRRCGDSRWMRSREDGGFVNVREAGVAGDGVTDDSAALQYVLSALGRRGGGVAFAPAGRYLFNTIVVPGGVVLAGEGVGKTLFARAFAGRMGNPGDLFGICLGGDHAMLRDCTVIGLWNPDGQEPPTYDVNVAVFGNDVRHCSCVNVESCNSHLGFLVGGIIQNPSLVFRNQSYTTFDHCFAHDTRDNGFGLVAIPDVENPTSHCVVRDCVAARSLDSAGLEIRGQEDALVCGFRSVGHRNPRLGAGVRLEGAMRATVEGLQTGGCAFGLQIVDNCRDCRATGVFSDEDTHGVLLRDSVGFALSDFFIRSSRSHGIVIHEQGAKALKSGSDGGILVERGTVAEACVGGAGYGILVVGSPSDRDPVTAVPEVVLRAVHVVRTRGHGIYVKAAWGVQIVDCALVDNGAGDGWAAGIVFDLPGYSLQGAAVGSVTRCLFRSSGRQRSALEAPAGGVVVGDVRVTGVQREPGMPHLSGGVFIPAAMSAVARLHGAPALDPSVCR
jgi:hypothetical protein